MSNTNNWMLEVNLSKKLKFSDVVHTNLRPDILLQSVTKPLVIVELTVLWMRDAIPDSSQEHGWQTWLYQEEAGYRGFQAKLVCFALGSLGRVAMQCRQKLLGKAAESASRWLQF